MGIFRFLKWWWNKYDAPSKIFGLLIFLIACWVVISIPVVIFTNIHIGLILISFIFFLFAYLLSVILVAVFVIVFNVFKNYSIHRQSEADEIVRRLRGH